MRPLAASAASTSTWPASALTASPSTCGGISVTLYTPALETNRNCAAPHALACAITGPTLSRSLPLLSTTTSNDAPGSAAPSADGSPHAVATPAARSSSK